MSKTWQTLAKNHQTEYICICQESLSRLCSYLARISQLNIYELVFDENCQTKYIFIFVIVQNL